MCDPTQIDSLKAGVFTQVSNPDMLAQAIGSFYGLFTKDGKIPTVLFSVPHKDPWDGGVFYTAYDKELQLQNTY